MALALATKN
jgi:hypothetical protein